MAVRTATGNRQQATGNRQWCLRVACCLLPVAGCLFVGRAHADPLSDADIISTAADKDWKIEEVELRTSYYTQSGHGFQSQDGSPGSAGSEALSIYEPWAMFRIRQNDRVTHEITIPVDIITAASPNAVDAYKGVDAMSTASQRNESADLDIRTTIKVTDVDTITTRFTAHGEEPLGSGTAGAGYRRSLADDNATIGINGSMTIDLFDIRDHLGDFHGKTDRITSNANVSASQLLSPTTVVDGSYGITYQHGTLDPSGWNAVPVSDGTIVDEQLPHARTRHAWSVRLAQRIPQTDSTLKLSYRYYLDDFGVRAHTIEVDGYQYLVPWLYVRASYRFHHQTGASFFTTDMPVSQTVLDPRTSDSDLAPFDAHEWSASIVVVRGRAPAGLRAWSLAAELLHYWRTNDLQVSTVSLSLGRTL